MKLIFAILACSIILQANAQKQFQSIEINLNEQTKTSLNRLVEEVVPLTQLIVLGSGTDAQWRDLCNAFKKSTALQSLILRNNDFETLPDELTHLKWVQSICIEGNVQIDLSSTVTIVTQLANLRSLEIEIGSVDDLPPVLFECSQLERLVLHEHLDSTESVAAECIAMQMPLTRDGVFYKNIKAYVYLSAATWQRMQVRDEFAGMKRLKPCQTFAATYKHVVPPISSQDIEPKIQSINANAGGYLDVENSSTILRIPENAFVDAQGNVVKDDVQISYREFNNPLEFIRSGIPMSYEENGETVLYESAGMVDISAQSKGEPVFLADGKTIDILVTSSSSPQVYDVWNFDDENGNWLDVGDSQVLSDEEKEKFVAVSQAVFVYLKSPYRFFKTPDSTSFMTRFSDEHYYNATYQRSKDPIQAFDQLSFKEKWMHRSANQSFRLKHVRKSDDGHVYFELKANRHLHPEVSKLGGLVWRVENQMTPAEVRREFKHKHFYGDMRLARFENAYKLILKEGGEIKELPVVPTKMKEDKDGTTYQEVEVPFGQYQKALNKRAKRFDKMNLRKFKQYQRRNNRQLDKVKRNVKPLMTDAEAAMDWNEFDTYAKAQWTVYQKSRDQNLAVRDEVTRILSVNRLGLCNIDRLKILPEQQVVGVEILVDNVPVVLNQIYITIRNINTVVANPVSAERRYQRVTLFGTNASSMLFITHDNRIGMVDSAVLQEAFDSHKGLVSVPARLLPIGADLSSIEL